MNLLSISRNALGKTGENLARFIIREKTNLESVTSIRHYGDLLLSNGVFIEVKTIRQNKDSTYRATIEKTKSQHLGHSDFLMLQVVITNDHIRRYIIPVEIIKTKRITISNLNCHKYQNYEDNYDLLLNYAKAVEQTSNFAA